MQSYLLEYAVDWLTKSLFFVIQITFFAILFLFIEKIRPIQKNQTLNREKKAELYLMLLNGIVINPFLYFLIISIFTGTLSDFLPYQIFDSQIQSLPFIIQVFFGLLLIDIKVYIRHRFTHNYMWQVHAVHHTAHDINWVTGSRLHPSEILVDIIFTIPFMYLLGFSGEGIVYASFIVFLFNMFTHLNLIWSIQLHCAILSAAPISIDGITQNMKRKHLTKTFLLYFRL